MKNKLIKKIFKLIEEEPEKWSFNASDYEYVFAHYKFYDGAKITVSPINSVNIVDIKVYGKDYRTIYEIGVPFNYFAMPFGWRRRMCRRLMKVYTDHVNNDASRIEFEEKYLSDV